MTTRTLYGYWRSSASYRVRIALALKELDYDHVAIDLRQGAQTSVGFTMMNPQGLIPFLIDGDVGLNQSLAIIEYLDEVYPDPPLLPADAVGRARVRGAALQIAADIHPINNLRVLKYLKAEMAQEQDAVDTWYRHWVETGFTALEEIAEGATGAYLFGDAPTLADLCLVPQMWNARRLQADIARFPKLVAIDTRLNALPAVAAARPETQPDAVR